jgi:hypothetical protein
MYKFLVLPLIFLPAIANADAAQCMFMAQDAKSVMMAHQYGIPVSKVLDLESEYPEWTEIVKQAYASPILSDVRYRAIVGDSFGKIQYAICMDKLG